MQARKLRHAVQLIFAQLLPAATAAYTAHNTTTTVRTGATTASVKVAGQGRRAVCGTLAIIQRRQHAEFSHSVNATAMTGPVAAWLSLSRERPNHLAVSLKFAARDLRNNNASSEPGRESRQRPADEEVREKRLDPGIFPRRCGRMTRVCIPPLCNSRKVYREYAIEMCVSCFRDEYDVRCKIPFAID
ncbi:hypothetical protein Trydic_g7796 [Trypoxylus dichotomus]